MTEYELLRIITFLERMRSPYDKLLKPAEPDANWNMILYLMKVHLRGENVTMSSLASAAGVPFASAMRRIHKLIETGDIQLRKRGDAGKSHYVEPSRKLAISFTDYATRVKALLADTFGLKSGSSDSEDYYFGGSYFAGQIIPPLEIMEKKKDAGPDLRFLLHDDNYFASMRDMWSDFRSKLIARKNFKLLNLPELREEVFANARRKESQYDVIAINMPWLGEAVAGGVAQPLTEFLKSSSINPLDFHPNIWATGNWSQTQFGIPIYCTIEALSIRKDLFEERGLTHPTTFDKVIDAARALHNPKRGMQGVVWNAAKGMPVSHSFMFFMGCCGGPVIDIPSPRLHVDYSKLKGEAMRPRILSESGRQTLKYMHELLAFSPPDILSIDWNKALNYFLGGQAAMIYCWTMRAARFEYDIHSLVKRKVAYFPHPHGPGGTTVSPIGGFLLMVPESLPPERARLAFEAISWMASPSAMKEYVKNGFPVAPRFSVSADPEAAASTPIVSFVDRLAKQNKIQNWQRPPIPEYHLIEEILGEEIFAALNGDCSDEVALARSQNRIDAAMREAGYY
ncbi:extracellular solute-binding protein [Aestuariivirga litoralis]|uniref:extracellular solute-binding protein n=1 Tax=Aestuariivirga litoralis TaxID=2650924 RepID=UPI0018C608B5|nr:extracellular solute-binding protein [Aestuariivirga litoralis]MBG1231068.1 extracellular solute-binding protein [Aestuariivirga litoralis]